MPKRIVLTLVIMAAVILAFIFSLSFLQRVEYKEWDENWEESISYETKRVPTDSMWEGEEEISQKGESGLKRHFKYYRQKYVNGKPEGEKEEIFPSDKPREQIVKQPVDEFIRYGTKRGRSTNYVWHVKEDPYDFLHYDFKLSITELNFSNANNSLEIVYYVENHGQDSLELVTFYLVSDTHPFGYNLENLEGNERIESSERARTVAKYKDVDKIWPKDFFLSFWGRVNHQIDGKPLSKFWVGTFNQQ